MADALLSADLLEAFRSHCAVDSDELLVQINSQARTYLVMPVRNVVGQKFEFWYRIAIAATSPPSSDSPKPQDAANGADLDLYGRRVMDRNFR